MAIAADWGHPDAGRWYILRTLPCCEFVAERLLRDLGFVDTVLPLKHIRKQERLFARPRLSGFIFSASTAATSRGPMFYG